MVAVAMALFQPQRISSSSSSFYGSFKESGSRRSSASKHKNKHSRCIASWQELTGVLIFSAIPFTAVKAIANSPLGDSLRRRMEITKKAALSNSSNLNALAQKARKQSSWYGEERPRWLGPIPYVYPKYLTGELPGDYGFDIAGLAKDPLSFQNYFNFELLHARWAMLASLGALIPEILHISGAFHFTEPVWWRVGYSKLKGDTLDYLGIPGLHLAGSQGVIVIAICQALLMVAILKESCVFIQVLPVLSLGWLASVKFFPSPPKLNKWFRSVVSSTNLDKLVQELGLEFCLLEILTS